MHLEEFAEGKSFFHLLDPRVKFLAAIPYLFLLAIIPGWQAPFAALAFSIWWAIWARLDSRRLLNRLAFVNVFVLMIFLFLPLSLPGEQIRIFGLFSVSREGVFQALAIALKTNAIVLTTIVILGTTEVFSLAHALVHLKFPPKLVHLF
ncbi:MAG: energy-coupling factor transporter transmembrane component T, partial [Smithellaceae bacterium]|nr:energy-coupling factor transporter transmembrane component T [Smithellaceae bacterium]